MPTAKNSKHGQDKQRQTGTAAVAIAGDDCVLPFAVEDLDIRGRVVRLGAALDTLIQRHRLPEPVAALLAEAVTLTALLGSALKFQGKFSLQTQTDGVVPLLVCDYNASKQTNSPAALRAYTRFDAEKLAAWAAEAKTGPKTAAALLGKGTLAFTIDQGAHMQQYQGIVALDGISLEEAAQQYFAQSEQIPTKIRLATAELSTRESSGKVHKTIRGGGIMAQYLPPAHSSAKHNNTEEINDKWQEAAVLTATAADAEMTDPQIASERLLYRLFHQHGIRVFPAQNLTESCTCSREKLWNLLSSLAAEERENSLENGKISATCQFCSAVYEFSADEFAERAKTAKQ